MCDSEQNANSDNHQYAAPEPFFRHNLFYSICWQSLLVGITGHAALVSSFP